MSPMLALCWPMHVGPMLALCWPNLALSYPYVGPMLTLSWPMLTLSCPMLTLCWPTSTLSDPYVDPMFADVAPASANPHSSDRNDGGGEEVGRGWGGGRVELGRRQG